MRCLSLAPENRLEGGRAHPSRVFTTETQPDKGGESGDRYFTRIGIKRCCPTDGTAEEVKEESDNGIKD